MPFSTYVTCPRSLLLVVMRKSFCHFSCWSFPGGGWKLRKVAESGAESVAVYMCQLQSRNKEPEVHILLHSKTFKRLSQDSHSLSKMCHAQKGLKWELEMRVSVVRPQWASHGWYGRIWQHDGLHLFGCRVRCWSKFIVHRCSVARPGKIMMRSGMVGMRTDAVQPGWRGWPPVDYRCMHCISLHVWPWSIMFHIVSLCWHHHVGHPAPYCGLDFVVTWCHISNSMCSTERVCSLFHVRTQQSMRPGCCTRIWCYFCARNHLCTLYRFILWLVSVVSCTVQHTQTLSAMDFSLTPKPKNCWSCRELEGTLRRRRQGWCVRVINAFADATTRTYLHRKSAKLVNLLVILLIGKNLWKCLANSSKTSEFCEK